MTFPRFVEKNPVSLVGILLLALFASWGAQARDLTAANICSTAVGAFNQQFSTVNGLDANGDLPVNSGVIVHTIHGPGSAPTELNMPALNALTVDATRTCASWMNASPPVYLPWCGSNTMPYTHRWSDASSWSFIRHDTLIHGTNIQRPDEVVCSDSDNKRYGLIFSNGYMNAGNNLGCMYPLDGDTGYRSKMGCGVSQRHGIDRTDAQGSCPISDDLAQYQQDFETLLSDDGGQNASIAGSLICSLAKPQFELWVGARKSIDLSQTAWPVTEFVLWNWETYSTADLAQNGYLVGIFYLTGCAETTDGTLAEAQAIADLYSKWSGVDLPVVNLSNGAMRAKSMTPFSCN